MNDGVNIGSAYFDLRAKDNDLKRDFEQAKNSSKKTADEMNNQLSKIKIGIDKTALDSIQNGFKNLLTTVSGLYAIQKVTGFIKDVTTQAAEFEEVASYFKGSAEEMQNLRKATQDTVSDMSLMKLSNQAKDLGVEMKDQPILFALAKRAGEAYGGDVSEGMNKVIMATEGSIKGVSKLGIEKGKYKKIVDDLAKAHGGLITEMDAETQKSIRIEALLRASGITMKEVNEAAKSHADRIETVAVKWENLKIKIGKGLTPFFAGVFDYLSKTIDKVEELGRAWTKTFTLKGSEDRKTGFFETIKNETEEQINARKDILNDLIADNKKENERLSGLYSDLMYGRKEGKKGDSESDVNLIQNKIDANKKLLAIYYEQQSVLMNFQNLQKQDSEKNKTDNANGLTPEAIAARKQKQEEADRKREEAQKQYLDLLQQTGDYTSQYFKDKFALIDEEVTRLKKAGGEAIDVERAKAAKIKEIVNDLNKYIKDKTGIDLSPEGLRGFKATTAFDNSRSPRQNADGTLNKVSGHSKPTQEWQSQSGAEIMEEWVKGSQVASSAMDGFINGAISGLESLKIKVSTDANFMIQAFAGFANYAMQAIEQIVAKWAVLNFFGLFMPGGAQGFNLFSMLKSASGGTFMNNTRIPAFAGGVGSYMVPNGYPNDSFPVMVQSGEDLRVRTPAQRAAAEISNQALINEITAMKRAIYAQTKNNAQTKEVIVPVYMDGQMVAVGTTKRQNDFERFNNKVSR